MCLHNDCRLKTSIESNPKKVRLFTVYNAAEYAQYNIYVITYDALLLHDYKHFVYFAITPLFLYGLSSIKVRAVCCLTAFCFQRTNLFVFEFLVYIF